MAEELFQNQISTKPMRELIQPTRKNIPLQSPVLRGVIRIPADSYIKGRNLEINSDYVTLKIEPSQDNTASGLIGIVTVDTNTNGIGSPLALAADGHFDDADADSSANCGAVVLALETGTGSKKVLFMGIIRNDGWNWTLGAGKANLIYLDTTAGTLTQTQPSGTDDVIQPVGWAITDDCIFFNPSLMYFTHT